MGKVNGFLEYERTYSKVEEPMNRIKHFHEFHQLLSTEEQAKQGARCMDCGVPFCQYGQIIMGMVSGCPLNNLIPEWNDMVFKNNYEEALKRLLKTNNFPEFTARVCPALCEKACTCSLHGEAVAVKDNELAIIEYGFEHMLMEPCPPKKRVGKKIAIVGSGPAGLAAADQFNQRGYDVDVFERDDRIGGLLMYGIPQMKIEKNIIKRREDKMTAEGVRFFVNHPIDSSTKAKELLANYDAVLLACGARKARDIDVKGRQAPNILFAVDYLTQITKSLLNSQFEDKKYYDVKGKKVLIIGGGDTGNDCVATAIRHGCQSVVQLEMMPEAPIERTADNPWPQWPLTKKTDYGQEESIAVFGQDPRLYQTTVKEFIHNDQGEVKAAILVSLENKIDDNSHQKMRIVEGSEKKIAVDVVLIAAGFIGCEPEIAQHFGITLSKRQTVETMQESYRTNTDKVYVAGDMRRGQSLVVWAIREGREAAKMIDEDLMGYSNL